MLIDDAPGEIHFLLLGVSPRPVGGYKVVYEYANALVAGGITVHVWHSTAFYAQMADTARTYKQLKAALRALHSRLRTAGNLVSWFNLDPRVHVHLTAGLPRPALSRNDAVIATAIETTEHAGALGRQSGAHSASLIQHLETWSAPIDYIRRAWAAVDTRITIAPWLAEECTHAGLSSVTIPNAIVADDFPPGPSLAHRPRRVLSLLSPHRYKRPDVVIDALREIHQLVPDAELVTFGQQAAPESLPAYIEHVVQPSPARLRSLYQGATVYLCGSDAEGWHLPPAEATLSGAAVVSTDIGGVRVSMEDDALYATAGDALGLARAAESVLIDPAAAQERVDRARSRILSRTYATNSRELLEALGMARGLTLP